MAASRETVQVIIVTSLCLALILLRCTYRLVFKCHYHAKCHRKRHVDDLWMAFSVVPLIGRAVMIAWSLDAASDSLSSDTAAQRAEAKVVAQKLLIPSRICYMLFLWFMKMCLLELYLRLAEGIPMYLKIGRAIRWSLYITAVAVILSTVLECRPLALAWNGDPAGTTCRKGRANLITMAACNIVTDLALILFPITILRQTGLELMRLLRLSVLFALGSLIIVTTIVRLPLILHDGVQSTRSLWASIEIVCACFIANAPFLQAVIIDFKLKGSHSASLQTLTQTQIHNNTLTQTQSELAATRTRSRSKSFANAHLHKRSLDSTEDGDEIGLWQIEKRSSFRVVEEKNWAVGNGLGRGVGGASGDSLGVGVGVTGGRWGSSERIIERGERASGDLEDGIQVHPYTASSTATVVAPGRSVPPWR